MKKTLLSLSLLLAAQLPAQAAEIHYADFSSTAGLTLNGNAARVGNVLRVTPATFNQAGSAFSTTPISLAADVSFSTAFQFRFSQAGGACQENCGADGLTFVVQTNSSNVGGLGGGIGYQGIPNSVGIEFDTWNNGSVDDFNGNHVGINVGGNIDSVVTAPVAINMNNGAIWSAWVDYNGSTDLLEVFLSTTDARPLLPILALTRDLATDLGTTSAFVGFTSGTGDAFANHDVLSWTFRDTFAPISVGEPQSLALLLCALSVLGFTLRPRAQGRVR